MSILDEYLQAIPFSRLIIAIRNPEVRKIAKEDDEVLDLEVSDTDLAQIVPFYSFFKDKNGPMYQLCIIDKDWMIHRVLKGRIILKMLK